MKDVNKIIKNYEPMMHRLLKLFKVKKDYEDILQLLRIKTWEILRDEKYNKFYKTKDNVIPGATFFTFLYLALKHRLINILKVEYRLKVKKDDIEVSNLPINKKIPYFIEHPEYYLGYSADKQAIVCSKLETAENIRSNLDFEFFCDSLSSEDRQLLELKVKGLTTEELAKECKCTKRTIDRRLSKLKKAFKKYWIEGGL